MNMQMNSILQITNLRCKSPQVKNNTASYLLYNKSSLIQQ